MPKSIFFPGGDSNLKVSQTQGQRRTKMTIFEHGVQTRKKWVDKNGAKCNMGFGRMTKNTLLAKTNFGSGVCHGGGSEGWGKSGARRLEPRMVVPPKGGRPKISRFFSLSRSHFVLFSLSGCLLVEFWLCF